MKRMALVLFVFLLAVGSTVAGSDAFGQQRQAAQGGRGGGGGGNGGGNPDPNYVVQLTINDSLVGAQLRSDGKHRVAPDGELETPATPLDHVVYQDYLLDFAGTGTFSDPCAQFEISSNSSPGQARLRFSRRLADSSRCDLAPENVDDARTFTVVFDKNDAGAPGEPDSGGACACNRFRYLVDGSGNPAIMSGGIAAQTGFVEDADSCAVTLAAGMIVWPNSSGENAETAVPIITAWPFEDMHTSKKDQKKAGQSEPGVTDMSISFHTDVVVDTDENFWRLTSQGESIPVAVDSLDADVRTITSSGHLFDLSGPSHLFPSGGVSQCSSVSMTFEMSMRRIDANQ
ncbi:MAG: hypothetical protein PVJ49_00385 [Acidobacteriota bacterium]|jgi:hypothetical protein